MMNIYEPLERDERGGPRCGVGTTNKERTILIDKLQRKHPGTRRQRSAHGAGRYSVQFFDKITGKLVADYNL